MTRLRTQDFDWLGSGIQALDGDIRAATGLTLAEIAVKAMGSVGRRTSVAFRRVRVGVVATSAGAGVLPGFTEAVSVVLAHIGFDPFVPEAVDVAGLAAAVEEGARVVFLADDDRFVALNVHEGRVVDNAVATGLGYAVALEGLARGVSGRRVLVIGAGRVGRAAARRLRDRGAQVGILDRDLLRARRLADELSATLEPDVQTALARYPLVVEASPATELVEARHVGPETMIAAPGIPLGVTPDAKALLGGRLLHEPLAIGVATMAVGATARKEQRESKVDEVLHFPAWGR